MIKNNIQSFSIVALEEKYRQALQSDELDFYSLKALADNLYSLREFERFVVKATSHFIIQSKFNLLMLLTTE